MNDLVVIESLVPADVFKSGGGDPIVDRIRQEVLAVDRDISTEEGRKNVASLAYKVARSKTLLDEMGKTFASDLKLKVKAIDSERGRIWDSLEALQKEVRQPLTEFEEAEKAKIAGHEAALLALENSIIFDGFAPTPAEVQKRIDDISPYAARVWDEFEKRGGEAYGRASVQLQKLLAERQKHEADQAELERLRKEQAEREQRERDEKLKAEAADRARQEAEAKAKADAEAAEKKAQVERDAIEREKRAAEDRAAKAEQDKRDSEAKAKADVERMQREAAEAAARAERDKKEAEERARHEREDAVRRERERAEAQKRAEDEAAAKREADLKHRAKINNAALKALTDAGLSEEHAKLAIEAIAKRLVPHINITY